MTLKPLAIALAVFVASTGTVAAQQMPERFLGVWQPVQKGELPSCAPNDADIRMEVLPDTLELAEGRCRYGGLEGSEGPTTGSVTFDLICEEEGGEWSDRQRWQVEASGAAEELLVAGMTPGNEFEVIYGRCPADSMRYIE